MSNCIASRLLLLVAFCAVQSSSLFAQTRTFEIVLFGHVIGEMSITKTHQADGSDLYTLDSKSEAKILWINRSNTSHYDVVYKDGKLISSSHIERENGRLSRWTKVRFDGKVYQVESYKGKRTFTEAPDYSIVTIYCDGKRNDRKIFYEAEAEFNEVSWPDANTMEFKSGEGNRNVYHYVNGKVHDMEFHVSIATVYMRQKQ
ncbi:MAG: DUF6134 family protein [Chitinophagales bacterium]